MKTDFSGSFWNIDNVKEADIGVILNEGKYEEKKNSKTGQSYTIFNIGVEIGGSKKDWSPSKDSGIRLQQAFGEDSKDWLGKKVQFKLVKGFLEAYPLV